jgi:hypothetical protein
MGKANPTGRSCGFAVGREKVTDYPRSLSPGIEIKPDGKHALLVSLVFFCFVGPDFSNVAAAVLDLVDGKSRNDYLPRITRWGPWEGEASGELVDI